jgi:DNA-binding XRE family transcriptional regulator
MITPQQCRAARAWLDWSQEQLAKKANVALSTVRSFEKGDIDYEPIANNVEAIQKSLESGGIEFTSAALEAPGVRFNSRIKESDTYLPVLELLDAAPAGFLKTSEVIFGLDGGYFKVSGEDAEILEGRSDTKFSQIVRNIVSHKTSPKNIIGKGHAEYDKAKRGLRITKEGRLYLYGNQPLKTQL